MNKFVKYALLYISAVALLALLNMALIRLIDFDLPSGVSTVVPTIFAAMMIGQDYAKKKGNSYPKALAWKDAFLFTGIVAIVNAVILSAIIVAMPNMGKIFATLSSGVLFLVVGFVLCLVGLINRYFLTAGSKAALKVME